jgi:prepilin-type N-terminal cleavage/methylation domain-containing protein
VVRERRAFTLIEILAVVAIIGILAAILLPSIGRAMETARRLKDASNMRQIAIAYVSYVRDGHDRNEIAQCKNVHEFANVLAKHKYLATPEVYFSETDPLVASSHLKKPKVIGKASDGPWRPNADFMKFPLSVVAIVNVSSNAPETTTPILYTRGLDIDSGRWKKDATYGEEGGFIAFLDGHVRFFHNVADGET